MAFKSWASKSSDLVFLDFDNVINARKSKCDDTEVAAADGSYEYLRMIVKWVFCMMKYVR